MGSIGNSWRELDIAIIGGGIGMFHPAWQISPTNVFKGGLATATSLRKAGHKVTIYERADFAGEVGASISCAANGTRWLEEWGVNVPMGKPVILKKLIAHDWKTGEVQNVYDLADYKDRWGYVGVDGYNNSNQMLISG
jgi:salicylate hydroxylase